MSTLNDERQDVDVIVVGGGLAGLSSAALLARAGRSVVVLERGSHLGGRAATHVRDGVGFNLGPHALYCHGEAFRLFQSLGVPFSGAIPNLGRGLLLDKDQAYRLPTGLGGLLGSGLLSAREKGRMLRFFVTLRGLDTPPFDHVPLSAWIARTAGTGNQAALLRTLFRVSTYAADHDRLSAGAALDRLRVALLGNVWYIDGGWQSLVDGLRDRAIEEGAELHMSARAASVMTDGDGVSVGLADGTIVRGRAAILAASPSLVEGLLDLPADAPLSRWSRMCVPIKAACLDVALDELPRPAYRGAFGLNGPFYLTVHSASAKLAPEGIAVLHAMKYLETDAEDPAEGVEQELEAFLERLQPGWMGRVVTRRYLPGMIVAHSLPRADEGGLQGRPSVVLAERPGVFLAGDWVGPEGMLADASAASAEEAARQALAYLDRTTERPVRSASHARA